MTKDKEVDLEKQIRSLREWGESKNHKKKLLVIIPLVLIPIFSILIATFNGIANTPFTWEYNIDSNKVSISSDGNYILLQGSKKLSLFSSTSPNPLWEYDAGSILHSEISSNGNYISAISVSKLFLFSKSSSVPLWNHTHKGTRQINDMDMSSDGSYIILGTGDNISLFHKSSSTPSWTNNTLSSGCVSISSDSLYISSIGSGKFNYFSRFDSNPLWQYSVESLGWDIEISSNGDYAIVGGRGKVSFFNLTIPALSWTHTLDIDVKYGEPYVEEVEISANGTFISISTNDNGNIFFFNSESSEPFWSFYTSIHHEIRRFDLSMSSDGRYLIAAGGGLLIFQNDSSQSLAYLEPITSFTGTDYWSSVDISSNGDHIVACTSKKLVFMDREAFVGGSFYRMLSMGLLITIFGLVGLIVAQGLILLRKYKRKT